MIRARFLLSKFLLSPVSPVSSLFASFFSGRLIVNLRGDHGLQWAIFSIGAEVLERECSGVGITIDGRTCVVRSQMHPGKLAKCAVSRKRLGGVDIETDLDFSLLRDPEQRRHIDHCDASYVYEDTTRADAAQQTLVDAALG